MGCNQRRKQTIGDGDRVGRGGFIHTFRRPRGANIAWPARMTNRSGFQQISELLLCHFSTLTIVAYWLNSISILRISSLQPQQPVSAGTRKPSIHRSHCQLRQRQTKFVKRSIWKFQYQGFIFKITFLTNMLSMFSPILSEISSGTFFFKAFDLTFRHNYRSISMAPPFWQYLETVK